jgi:hypothetical protein
MTFTISSVTPSSVLSDGGRKLEITGVFEAGHRYSVHIGELGHTGDPRCVSGIPSEANFVYPKKSTVGSVLDLITVYTPRINPDSTAYCITVIDYDTSEAHMLNSVVTAVKNQYFTTVYAERSLQPPHYKTGPRSINIETPT